MRVAIGDGCQGGLEIGEGLDAVDFAGLDQRCDAAPGDAAFIVTGEECIFAIEGDRAGQVFDPVGVDFDPSCLIPRFDGAILSLEWKDALRPCIPGRKSRGKPIRHDKRRNRIEIMFGRLKDWRRVATRYDRCPKVFLSAIALAATVIFWL